MFLKIYLIYDKMYKNNKIIFFFIVRFFLDCLGEFILLYQYILEYSILYILESIYIEKIFTMN